MDAPAPTSPPASPAQPVAPPPPKVRAEVNPRKRRWFLWLIVALLVLVIALLITVTLVLRTDYPRQIVIAQIEKTLGLRVQAKTLTTGWAGHTRLSDVTLSLPLADESFFAVPRLEVNHT